MLWFQSVQYLSVFLTRLGVQLGLGGLVTALTAIYLLANLGWAQRLKPARADRQPVNEALSWRVSASSPMARTGTARLAERQTVTPTRGLRLRSLLPLTLGLSLLLVLLLAHYGQLLLIYWQPQPEIIQPRIPGFGPRAIAGLLTQVSAQPWGLALLAGAALTLLVYPRPGLGLGAVGLSLLLGALSSRQWATLVQALHPTRFDAVEPLLGQDISFYIFSLPALQLLCLWLTAGMVYAWLAVALTYLLAANSLSQGYFAGFSAAQQRHLYGAGSGAMATIALSYWLSRYNLLYSPRGVSFGASYTDATVQLPVNTGLSLLALVLALYLLVQALGRRGTPPRSRLLLLGLGLYGGLVVLGFGLPQVVQYLIVQPNELARERPYIQRTIALTRRAFGLEAIDTSPFNPAGRLTQADLTANELTVRNIRLWDQRPLLETNRELQQIRPYYRFPDADIDRYTLQSEVSGRRPAAPPAPGTAGATPVAMEQRQVLLAARELDYSAVPQQAQTWVNQHLIYTHGYGFTLSPVNTAGSDGLPEYFVKDISGTEAGALATSSPAIRASIPIGQPRIYFGEITDTYVMTQTKTKELDYPSGSDNVYNVYDGRDGINIGSWWRRGLFAVYLRDWRILFTRDFLPDTRVLFRRNINQRIRAIAPFLRYDDDPYLVAADPRSGQDGQNYLYWIVDAYTTSNYYPYSDSGSENINYIRNSVKVVIDAYHGSVDFYIADVTDPVITTWSKIFPGMLKPLSTMPAALQQHLRYPEDFFKLQSERLMTYHMTDPQVFYNREDQWQLPNEVYGNEARAVEPYYLITSLPKVPFEEFILLLPYTPRQRTNLIAWLAARSDGTNYGKLLLYTFPKERLVYGPEQIEARINQDPVISQQISLWNRQGSRAIQGNLLVIPIEQSLLYVEPLYLEAAQNSLPTLVRVIVAYENRIVMAPTLDEALQAIFKPTVTPGTTIIRPVE